ncbi:putative secreted protein (Por secretion system target) [Arcticibacter tournemirensis]|uniref:T9SS type A sorting domain-containing protein n=1 Tax=Arcticibacter tournemirensis TaxID=699437 RepID=A0A5M9HF70_9SPHI|nr:T9SS type A sorting domain-containing protein [Arcticibacter tournemirensis]KAA8485253.1 T9SS type A sorting domain-containing protein [Arcticibacter tournemirensis]TQM50464.1 putative secreted protein (Por secretion system target) [Arcticibacter tournemirensis]
MKKFYLLAISFYFILLGARAFDSRSFVVLKNGLADSTRRIQRSASKITDTRPNRPSRNDVGISIIPFKPISSRPSGSASSGSGSGSAASSAASPQKVAAPDFKALSNVKVFPNPVEDQINISYTLSKDANVTIKIMDVLGNEIATLLSQRLPSGEQNHSFAITSRLNSGYYFIRLIAGNETIIKRISVL